MRSHVRLCLVCLSLFVWMVASANLAAYSWVDYEWYEYNGHWYALTIDYGCWLDAEAEAVALGGHLVTVNDAEENASLTETFGYNYTLGFPGDEWSCLVWIGLRGLLNPDGTIAPPELWYWANGEPVDYVAPWWWAGLFPGPGGSEFAYLHPEGHPDPGTWLNSDHCTDPLRNPRGIIEVNQPPPFLSLVCDTQSECEVSVSVMLDNMEDVWGVSLGLISDPLFLVPSEILPGASLVALGIDGSLPGANLAPAPTPSGERGITWAAVFMRNGELAALPPGADQEIVRIVYRAASTGTSMLRFSGDLGEPPVALEVSVGFPSIPRMPATIDGETAMVGVCFVRGDVDGNGRCSINDPIRIFQYLFCGASVNCLDSADANDDGNIGIVDPIFLIDYLFRMGPTPPLPFSTSGPDPTEDALDCRKWP